MNLGKQIGVGCVIVIATTGIVYGVLSMLPKTYSSSQSIYFPLAQSSSAASSALSALGAGSKSGADAIGASSDMLSPLVGSSPGTATGILKSRTCLLHVVKELNLDGTWDKSLDESVEKLKSGISVSTDDNGLLVISAQAEKPELCVEIIETMYAFLQKRADELTLNVGKQNRIYIQERVDALQEKVDTAEENYIAVATKHKLGSVSELGTGYLNLLTSLSQSQAEEKSAETRLSDLQDLYSKRLKSGSSLDDRLNALSTIDPSAMTSMGQAVTNLAKELQTRRLTLEEISKQFTKSSPEYRAAKKSVEASEGEAKSIISGANEKLSSGTLPGIGEARNALAGLKATNRSLQSTVDQLKSQIRQAPNSAVQIERAQAEYQASLQLLGAAESQLEKARLIEQNDPARFEVLDPAMPVNRAVAPRKAFLSGVWALFASACAGWIILRSKVKFVE